MQKQLTVLNSTTRPTSSIGGSILPSSDLTILQPLNGLHGVLQVRPMPEADTYGLFFTRNGGTSCLAQHSNGYSCHNLALRLIDVWAGKREPAYALAQFDYILACAGLGAARESIVHMAAGFPEASGEHEQKMSEITMPPNMGSNLIGMLIDSAQGSAEDLRNRVSNVRHAPLAIAIEKNCECIYFDFDGQTRLGELRGRNRNFCIDTRNPEAEANRAVAVRVFLDRNATLIQTEQPRG